MKSLILFWLCLALSASALSTHSHRALAHRGLARRAPLAPIRKRADGKRCRPRTSSLPHSTPVANVAPLPTTSNRPSPTKVDEPKTTRPPPPPPPPHDEPKTTQKPAPTTKPAPPPPPPPPPKPNTGGSFMSGTQTGQGTFYSTGLGACGVVNHDTDYIAAVSHLLFDNYPGYNRVNPNTNPLCNRKVRASYKGKSIVVALTDRCEGCALTDLDFSPSAFNDLADFSVGRISGMTWEWA